MKTKIVSLAALLCLSLTASAQWNNTGDSRTTGNLFVGNHTKDSEIRVTADKKAQLSFWFKNCGIASISGNYINSCSPSLNFGLLNSQGLTVIDRMKLTFDKLYVYPELRVNNNAYIGDDNLPDVFTSPVEGNRLYFAGTPWNLCFFYISKYVKEKNKSELRVNIGHNNGGYNKFVIGNKDVATPNVWRYLLTVADNGKVGIGVENPQNALDVNGTIRAKEVRVESGWADFVFDKDYKLPTLDEVKAHIDEHKHLPGIPSAEDVQENGLSIADMTTKMMQKIEELTLYVIQQNEEIQSLKEQLNSKK